MKDYEILLDSPAEHPALGFEQYAHAFAEIIRESDPRFAVGVFGDWGSGKTTLMRAIKRRLEADDTVVTVWFNAWRYEREEHLIVPLLDTLREALVDWSKKVAHDPDLRDRAIKAASTVARAARAILVGLTAKVTMPGLPGGPELGFDTSKAIADWRQTPDEAAQQPQSFYHVSFNALQDSLARFVQEGRQRIVVFIDDLDRCLPLNALEILESMKLFFDLQGFVFVVGLDQDAVERAIEAKYHADRGRADNEKVESPIKGSEYIKKIFQVPFTLPPISPVQLDEFLGSMYGTGMSDKQRDDLRTRVRPHLDFVITESGVNPREVKRYINAYTLQRKIRPNLDADVVLCLQTMAFRADWQDAYEVLLAEREAFTDAIRRQLSGEQTAVENLWPNLGNIPHSLQDYLASPMGQQLLDQRSLDQYIHSVEATSSTQTGLAEAYRVLGSLRGLLRQFDATEAPDEKIKLKYRFRQEIPGLLSTLAHISGGSRGVTLLRDLDELSRLSDLNQNETVEQWRRSTDEMLVRVRARLHEMRRMTAIGATS
jgi:hypothetical protein